MSEKRQPWMKWYPADWRSDPRLRMCSLAARGLWADMISLMHEAEPYGHLLIAGMAPTAKQLASLIGSSEKEVKALLLELQQAGVFSLNDDDVIYSRRMVRDRERSDEGKEWAEKRWAKAKATSSPNSPPNGVERGPPTQEPIAQRLEARSQMPESPSLRSGEPADAPDDPELPAFLDQPKPKEGTDGRRRRSRISEDWRPDEQDRAYAENRGFDAEWIERQAERFRDHHLKAGSLFADWNAAWRTWVQRAPEFARSPQGGGPGGNRQGSGGVIAALREL